MKDEKLFRLTFSRSLLEHINTLAGGDYEIQRYKVIRGKRIEQGELSSTGLYGIISQKDKILRVAMNQAQAEFLCDFKTRHLQEIGLAFTP